MKLLDILNEVLPKNRWVSLKGSELQDHSDDIFGIIKRTYTPLGGHPTYTSPKDVTTSGEVKFWKVIDTDSDPDVDAVVAGKKRQGNVKIGLIATDGSKKAKKAVVDQQTGLLKKYGYFAELSGRPAEIMLALGVPVVTDKELIVKLLNAKEVDDFKFLKKGWYQRRLKDGRLVQKVMVGVPKK